MTRTDHPSWLKRRDSISREPLQMIAARMRVALLTLMAGLSASTAASAGAVFHIWVGHVAHAGPVAAREAPSISQVTLRAFVLRPSGLLFSFHPTEARIVLTAVANERLRVCEDGTTFSHYWKGGCRTLARLPLALPTSGGAVHVGFRVMPSRAVAARVTTLRVRWHCVDHAFIIIRGATRTGPTSPSFDC
jgi:hypothetical protein